MKLTHVCIVTADLNRMMAFYRQVLTIEPQIYREEYVEFPTKSPGAILSLYSLESQEQIAPGAMEAALNHSVVMEFEVADVDREYARLEQLELDWVLAPPTTLPWGQRAIYFRDPDGNLLNFYSRIRD